MHIYIIPKRIQCIIESFVSIGIITMGIIGIIDAINIFATFFNGKYLRKGVFSKRISMAI